MSGPIFIVRLKGNGCDDIRELRQLLKKLLRGFKLRCISVEQELERPQ